MTATISACPQGDERLAAEESDAECLVDHEFWLPTVEGISAEGPVIGVLANAARLSEPERRRAGTAPLVQDAAPAEADVMSLLRLLRAEMTPKYDWERMAALYASEIRPEIWEAVEARSEDAGVRKAAVHALGSFPDDAARTALLTAVNDPVEDVRWNAAVALARRRDPAAAPVLLQMMDRRHLATIADLTGEQREEAVQQAVQAAGVVPDPALRSALEGLRDSDPSMKVRAAARAALEGPQP